jgi:dolichyl-phosphate-mannose--protein O-mannosyl transferase
MVTAVSQSDDHNSLWLIKSRDATVVCPRGTPVKNGQQIRLMHLQTKKHLQTFQQHLAALSRQQEASARTPLTPWSRLLAANSIVHDAG